MLKISRDTFRHAITPLVGVIVAVVYGVTTRFILSRDSNISGTLSVSFLLFAPPLLGMLTVAMATDEERRRYAYVITIPWVSAITCMVISLAFAWEYLLCVCVIAPHVIIASSLGGLAAKGLWHIFTSTRSRASAIVLLSLVPYVFAPIERLLPLQTVNSTVHSQIAIDAPTDVVWRNITNLEPIVGGEQREAFFHVIGLPRPLQARMACEAVGCVRYGQWEDGLAFRGTITQIEPGRRYTVALTADTRNAHSNLAPIQEVGDRVFGMVDDSYEIETGPDGKTILHLYSTYRIRSRVNPYAVLWLDFLMRDIQQYILNVEKSRAEVQN